MTVWGQHAINIDARHKEIAERPIIIILASTKLKTFRSEHKILSNHMFFSQTKTIIVLLTEIYILCPSASVQISTLPSSKIYMNMDIDVVTDMRQR